MILASKKATNIAKELYREMIKYSRSKSVFYQSVSPIDIKNVDVKIKQQLQENPYIAKVDCGGGVPFILMCADCGMQESVKWFLTHQNVISKDIQNSQKENIATYAYKVGLNDLLEFIKQVEPSLLDARDGNGLSVNKRIEIKEKEKELSRKNY